MNDHLQVQISTHYSPSLLFYLSSYGLLKVEGTGAFKLLQGQLTCDIEKLGEHEAVLGAHCNAKGRILSLFYLFYEGGSYYLLMRRDMLPIALAALKKYAIFYKVQLSEITFKIFIANQSVPNNDKNNQNNQSVSAIKLFDAFYLILNADFPVCEDENKNNHEQAWKKILINKKIPTLYPETSGKLLPHEIHLDELNGLCFNKGCYTGQEIIARMHYLGKTKNGLSLICLTSPAPPVIGSVINTTGMIVDYYQEENNSNNIYNNTYHVLIRDKKTHDEQAE